MAVPQPHEPLKGKRRSWLIDLGAWRFALVFIALLAFVALLTYTGPAPSIRPTTWWGWGGAGVPYLVVAFLGMTVALAELSSTFPNYPIEAINSRWGLGLIALNSSVAALVFAIVRYYTPDANLFLLVLAVGVGFQSIIRTRFVLARQFGENGEGKDLSVNLGWLYEQFQNLCKNQIDLALMRNRHHSIRRLLARYPDEYILWKLAYYAVLARGTFGAEEEERQLQKLREMFQRIPPEVAPHAVALYILETGGQDFAELLCGPDNGGTPLPGFSAVNTRKGVLEQLVAVNDVERLKAWALDVATLTPGEDPKRQKQFIEETCSDAHLSDAQRIHALALFIAQRVTLDWVAEHIRDVRVPGSS